MNKPNQIYQIEVYGEVGDMRKDIELQLDNLMLPSFSRLEVKRIK